MILWKITKNFDPTFQSREEKHRYAGSRDAGLTFVIMRSRTMLFAVRNGPDAEVEWELPWYFDDEAKILALHEPAEAAISAHHQLCCAGQNAGQCSIRVWDSCVQFYTTQLLNGYLLLEGGGDGS